MANEIPTKTTGTSITVKAAAAIEAGRIVKISADETVADAGSNEHGIGYTMKATLAANDLVAVELVKYTKKMKLLASGAIAAGEWVKLAAASGANQRVAKFTPGTDAEERKFGICLIGAADGATVTILA